MRFRQITSGFLPTDDGTVYRFARNPRLGPLEEWRDSCDGQGLLWANLDQEVDDCLAVLGPGAVRFDGRVGEEQRERNKAAFMAGDARWFVSKPAVGGAGLNLTAARHVCYYTNSFNLLHREQSEDRAHRPGQRHPVDYTDLVAAGTVDVAILAALRRKFDVSTQVTGDLLRSWL
jgi:SNF2 family DNA or RNA helicase